MNVENVKYLLPNSEKIDKSKDQLIIVNDFVNVREGAVTSSNKTGVVHKNEIYTILDKDPSGPWLQIEIKDGDSTKKGWIIGEQNDEYYVLEINGDDKK